MEQHITRWPVSRTANELARDRSTVAVQCGRDRAARCRRLRGLDVPLDARALLLERSGAIPGKIFGGLAVRLVLR
jgi:hypothetical protein